MTATYMHIGIPITEKKPNMTYNEAMKFWVSNVDDYDYKVEYLKFEEGTPFPEELHRRWHVAYAVDDLDRYVDDADVRVDRGEGIVRGQATLFGESGEQRGLAHVGQTDDSDGKCHGIPLLKAQRRKRCVYVNLAIIDRKGP